MLARGLCACLVLGVAIGVDVAVGRNFVDDLHRVESGTSDLAQGRHAAGASVTDSQLESAERGAENEARVEARRAGADKADQDAAAHQALQAVRFMAATESAEPDARGESGVSGESGDSGASGESGESGPPQPAIPPGPFNVKGAIGIQGIGSDQCAAVSLPIRKFIGGLAGKDEDIVKITDCDDAPEGAGGASGASGSRRRLLSLEMIGASAIAVEFLVKVDSAADSIKLVAELKAVKDEDLISHLKDSGINGVTGAGVLDSTIKGATTTTTTTTTTAPPVGHGPCGITYSWPVIGDEEIDKQAEIVAEWSARAMCRIDQEKNATAAVKGTRQEVLDFASAAMATTGDAIEAKGEPGDVVLRHLEKSQDDTITAKEKRRQLKVLKDYRKAVSIKRKAATNKRDAAIAELLRLKVLRINTAKALWMTLKNKLADLNELLMKRLQIAAKDAEAAKKSELDREPKNAVVAKFEASERAQAAARHVKVYANAVEYKASCAEALMHEWECKVLINCTVPEKAKEEEKPLWSTPTLDALNDKMMESITEYKAAKDAVPPVPPKPKPEKPGPVETRIMELEKKYGTGEFAPGMQGGACKLEGNRVGHFVKGSCVPFEEEKKALKEQAKAIAAEEAKQAAAKKGADGESGASGAAEDGASDEGEGKKGPKDAFAAIEKRILALEKSMK